MMHQRGEALALFRQVLAQYPASPFVIPARRFLRFLAEPENTEPMDARP
jgi:hypothetical protein